MAPLTPHHGTTGYMHSLSRRNGHFLHAVGCNTALQSSLASLASCAPVSQRDLLLVYPTCAQDAVKAFHFWTQYIKFPDALFLLSVRDHGLCRSMDDCPAPPLSLAKLVSDDGLSMLPHTWAVHGAPHQRNNQIHTVTSQRDQLL